MSAKELTLHIAVNLARLSRWAAEGRDARIDRFIGETEEFVQHLEAAKKNPHFEKTVTAFRQQFDALKRARPRDRVWSEQALTWSNILTHRAKLT